MVRLARASIAVVLLSGGVGVACARSGTSPKRPIPNEVRATVLIWGDGLFTRPADLDRWLRKHGETYAAWHRTHPAGRAILAQAATPVTFRPSQLPPKAPPIAPSPELPRASPAPLSRGAVEALVLALAGALVALGAVPVRRVAPNLHVASVLDRRRAALATAGAAIMLGMAVARLFG